MLLSAVKRGQLGERFLKDCSLISIVVHEHGRIIDVEKLKSDLKAKAEKAFQQAAGAERFEFILGIGRAQPPDGDRREFSRGDHVLMTSGRFVGHVGELLDSDNPYDVKCHLRVGENVCRSANFVSQEVRIATEEIEIWKAEVDSKLDEAKQMHKFDSCDSYYVFTVKSWHKGRAMITSGEQLRRWLLCAYAPEYLMLPALYYIGTSGCWKTGLAVQIGFLGSSACFQYGIFKSGASEKVPVCLQNAWIWASVAPESGFPFYGFLSRYCGVKKWHLDFIAAVPNYAHVPSTAIAIGGVWKTWPQYASEFARRWSYVPLVGGPIGYVGAPWVLTATLAVSAVLHGIVAYASYKRNQDYDEDAFSLLSQTDAANLLFLSKAMIRGELQHYVLLDNGLARMALGILAKVPMIWMKTSIFAIMFDSMSFGEQVSMTWAISLGWYGFLPLLINFMKYASTPLTLFMKYASIETFPIRIVSCFDVMRFCCMIGVLFATFVLALHFAGIFLCESHDFSVIHACTNPKDLKDIMDENATSNEMFARML